MSLQRVLYSCGTRLFFFFYCVLPIYIPMVDCSKWFSKVERFVPVNIPTQQLHHHLIIFLKIAQEEGEVLWCV